ncbi:two-component system sporulation sensor kinase A [Bacillus mesophilus]|uniref:histidine kinase n=1 Tax=Bacillus mesophilus TaxID=1808955 RepID=A0A6M0Q8E9_9BACI|nr:ATP-binding protein [Bacillus mesophilus]MBM7662093.1 two-component system sporulation sensor kinase A [Bacillus mesophilus]NEY72553.1 PAS domain S-box protein [Bacillus mesophilus]
MNRTETIDFEQIIERTLSGVVIIDTNSTVMYHNQTAYDLLECKVDNPLLSRDFSDFLHPHYHEICKERISQILVNKLVAEEMEQKLITCSGMVVDVEIKGIPYNGDKAPLALIFIRDITKQKKAERLLAHKDKLSSIGQFAAGIAHEVRNPLTAVKGFVQLLKEEMNHSYLETIESELQKALVTLNNLLQVSKPEQLNEPVTSINLCEELDAIIFLFQEKTYHIELIKNYQNTDILLLGKKNILVKSFFNLIKNAIEAINDKGKIFIEYNVLDGIANIKITDTGVGIPEEKLSMLGTPFYSTKDTGTGMGLTQVLAAVMEHKGQINIESKLGIGTTFHIALPIH